MLLALLACAAASADAETTSLDACLEERALPRVVRVRDPHGSVVFGRVIAQRDGAPVRVARLAPGDTPLAAVFERAADPDPSAETFELPADELAARVLAPVPIAQSDLDAETHVIVAAGLNYAAHAEEAGGGDVFVFPKPAAPSGPYGRVQPPAGVTLLDYEIELGFVLLEDLDPAAPPPPEALLERTAFLLTNDVSDREPIIREAALAGPGTGFVEGKGQPTFLPAGPWMVRGRELFGAVAACGEEGLGLRLWVDEGDGPLIRQDATTARMLLDPRALVARIGEEIARSGPRTSMPFERDGEVRLYPLAVGEPLRLTAGSLILTGTPEGVALNAPGAIGLTLRGLFELRSPFAQLIVEERKRAAEGARLGYLAPGDRVIARIDGLGAQAFTIAAPDAASASSNDAAREER